MIRLDAIGIRPRLMGAFLLLAAIATIIGIVGIRGMQGAKVKEDEFATDHLPAVHSLGRIQYGMTRIRLAQSNMLTEAYSKERSDQQSRLNEALKIVEDSCESYDALPRTAEEDAVWKEFVSEWNTWRSGSDPMLQLVEQGDVKGAANMFNGTLRKHFRASDALLDNMMDINLAGAKEADNQFDAGFASTKRNAIILIVLGVILAIAAGALISLSIVNPVRRLADAATLLADGDVRTTVESDAKDEIGDLCRSFNAMAGNIKSQAEAASRVAAGDLSADVIVRSDADVLGKGMSQAVETLRRLVSDARALNAAAASGDFTTRSNASDYAGGYREIMEGINSSLDTVAEKVFWYEGILDSIPFPLSVTDINMNWTFINKPVEDFLGMKRKDVLGKQCSNWNANICNTENCGIAGLRKNKLQTVFDQFGMNFQVDTSYLHNTKGEKIGHVEVVQDITARVKVAEYSSKEVDRLAGNLAKIAQGELNVDTNVGEADNYTATERENFVKINDNLARVTSAIGELVRDTEALSRAAIDGQLDARADVSKHRGEFRQVIDGVNATLDAIVAPINEAIDVLQSIADRDMTGRVTGDYKGDYARMKHALNVAIDNLEQGLGQVAVGAEQVASASVQIGTGSQALAQGASEQASSLEEISSSLQEMASMTKQNASNAKEARGMADGARDSADRGVESMRMLSEAMAKIKASSDETAKIIKTIDEIAFQTNLLALNAAVEAARAGDAGKGFAVVAEEVRNLAMRSAEAAKNTADMIEGSVQNAEEGVAINTEAMKNLEEINDQSRKVSEIISEIAAASEQQTMGIEQVNVAVGQMDQLTQQNAANSEESASAAQELSSQAQEMQAMVASFKISQHSGFAQSSKITRHQVSASTPRAKKKATVSSMDPAKMIPFDDSDALHEF